MTLKIGLTGGIGSGKTTIAGIFEVLGIPVYYADEAAKRLMNEDPELKKKIEENFGRDAYQDGVLNRSFIGSQVFQNKEKLSLLNSLVHPVSIRDANEWMKKQSTPYAIKEAALIFESGVEKYLDYVIGVSAPESLRVQRTMKRDNISRDQVLERVKNQMDEDAKIKLCDFIIYNDEAQPVLPQVLTLHGQLLQLSKK
jgi:dephospho-CoA kinase